MDYNLLTVSVLKVLQMELIILKHTSEYEMWFLFILSKVIAYTNIWALVIRIIFIRFQKRKQTSKYLILYLPRN